MKNLSLSVLPDRFAICRVSQDEPIPELPAQTCFWSITRTEDGLSVVLPEKNIPAHWKAERGWRCLKVIGHFDFETTGVLASLAAPLANAGISIFAVSAYETDYIMIKESNLEKAKQTLEADGHFVEGCI
jgi:hypothetical protein